MISAAGTTSSRRQPLALPTSMYSMKRSICPRSRKRRAISSTVWSLTPRLTTMLTLTGERPASCAAAIPSSTRSTGKSTSFIDLNTSLSSESRLTVMRLSPAALRARALRLRSEPLVVTVRSSSPSIAASMAMSCSTSLRTSGSPPEMRRSCRGRRSVSVRTPGSAAVGLRGRVRLPSLIEQLLEQGPGAHGGAAAMADHVLDVGRQLRHRPRLLRQVEDRVVSESQLSFRLKGDEALHLALEQPYALRALPTGRQAPPRDRHPAPQSAPPHRPGYPSDPSLVPGLSPKEGGEPRPRRAVQGVDLKPGVVGEGDETA